MYAAAVLDYFLQKEYPFDYVLGVSAGAGNLASYTARQYRRNYRYYADYSQDPNFLGMKSYLKSREAFGVHYIYGVMAGTRGIDPLDVKAMHENPVEFVIEATDMETGKSAWFTKWDIRDDHLEPLMASSAIPFFAKPVEIGGRKYCDGGVADPVPVQKALDDGCDYVVTILSHASDVRNKDGKIKKIYPVVMHKYPEVVRGVMEGDQRRQKGVRRALDLMNQGKGYVVEPSEEIEVKVGTTDRKLLDRLYALGIKDAQQCGKVLERTVFQENERVFSLSD